MSSRPVLDVGLNLVLGLAVALAAVGVADHFRGLRLEAGRVRLTRLDEATRERLDTLRDRVSITYYVSGRERMPSSMRRVERDVTDLLDALVDASGGRVEYQIVDPTGDQELIDFAARRRVTPVRVRSVSRDSYTEQEVWSTLTITYGPRRPAVIRAVGPEHLPRLQGLITAQLDQLERPRRRVVALAAPAGFDALRGYMALGSDVVDVAHDLSDGLPPSADALLWIEPPEVTPDALRTLDGFLERGRSLIVAGAALRPTLLEPGQAGTDERALVLTPTGSDVDALYGHFGLEAVDGLLLDERSLGLPAPDGGPLVPAPYRITCIANNQDWQELDDGVNGTVLFEAPTAIRFDAEALAERGWRATALGTTDRTSWARPWEGRPLPLSELPVRVGEERPKETLIAWLRHADPWRGQVVALAASTALDDEHLAMEGAAHRRLVDVLLGSLASDDRIVQGRAEIRRAEPLPALSAATRVSWRAVCVLGLPLLLAVASWWRRRGAAGAGGRGGSWAGPVVLRGAAGLLAVGLVTGLVSGGVDLTADGRNVLHPVTLDQARQATADAPVLAELIVSEPTLLPPRLRPEVRRLADTLEELADAAAGLTVTRVRPEALDEDGREALRAAGVTPSRVASHDEEATTVRTVWSALRLTRGERVEVLPFADADAFEHLEFRLAFALWRLTTGRDPLLVVAADTPRLSAAEAHEEFQRKQLIAPTGTDVYALARQALERVDFAVRRVDPRRTPLLDPDDTLLWFQPRRSVPPMLIALAEHLYRGGRAFLAAQHFNMQARQYRGRGFDFVYWPQPQSADIETMWLPSLGIELVRDVLFDELNLAIDDQAQIAGDTRRDFESMSSSLPFVIRAVGAHFDPDSVITRGLGDQAFVWASRIRLDPGRLEAAGLQARTLITTSEHSWSFDWKGGWIPDELLRGPPVDETTGEPRWLGRQPLAVDVTGSFPWPTVAFGTERDDPPTPYPDPEPVGEAAPGRLVMVGDSELFQSERLVGLRPDFRGDHLLLNIAADLALPAGLADVMVRRQVARGFGVVEESDRLRWRAAVVFAVPALLVLLAVVRRLVWGGR